MKVYIGADHRGVKMKAKIFSILQEWDYDIIDVGAHSEKVDCDYPKAAYKVATGVVTSKNNCGILVCMSGIGQSIAANKVKGAYAALCHNLASAKLSRQHNNANILVISAKFVTEKDLKKMLHAWFNTEFEGGRHLRRLNQIKKIEKGSVLK